MNPINTHGFNVEHYTDEKGWEPCTEPVLTFVEATAQLEKLDPTTHRVYLAINKRETCNGNH